VTQSEETPVGLRSYPLEVPLRVEAGGSVLVEFDGVGRVVAVSQPESGERVVIMRSCRHCQGPIRRQPRTSTGWTHGSIPEQPGVVWQGVRCPRRLTGAQPEEDDDGA
jgi:hypothetical protein